MRAWYALEIAGSIKSITYFIIFVMNLSGDISTICANNYVLNQLSCQNSFWITLYQIACTKVIHNREKSLCYWLPQNCCATLHEHISFLIRNTLFLFLCLRVEIKSKFQCFRFPNSYKYRITILNVCINFDCGI